MATTSMPVLRTRWVSWLVAAAKCLTPQDMIHSWTVTGVREVNLLHKRTTELSILFTACALGGKCADSAAVLAPLSVVAEARASTVCTFRWAS
jgi:hypothetical protein